MPGSLRWAERKLDAQARQTIAERVRSFPGVGWFDSEALVPDSDIGRATLVRLENGEQSPRSKTLKAVADALGVDTPDLLVEPEFLVR